MFWDRLILPPMWGHFRKWRTLYPVPTTVGLFQVLSLRLDLGFVQGQGQGQGTVIGTESQKVLTRIDKQGGVRHDTQARQRAGRQCPPADPQHEEKSSSTAPTLWMESLGNELPPGAVYSQQKPPRCYQTLNTGILLLWLKNTCKIWVHLCGWISTAVPGRYLTLISGNWTRFHTRSHRDKSTSQNGVEPRSAAPTVAPLLLSVYPDAGWWDGCEVTNVGCHYQHEA